MVRLLGRIAAVCATVFLSASATAAAQPGAFDSGFGGGIVTTSQRFWGVAVQPNGEVVAVGSSSAGNVFVQRFTTSGSPDGSYTGPGGFARAVAVEPNGDIVLAGGMNGAVFAERLTPNLQPDSSFGSGGIATTLGGSGGYADSIALGPGGQIVTAGQIGAPPNTNMAVVEFTSSGAPTSQLLGVHSSGLGVAVQPDGKIVAVGRNNPGQAVDALIVRLNPNGSLDSSFAGSGAETYDYPSAGSTVFAGVAIESDGKILVTGQSNPSTPSNNPVALFLRYNSSGSLDGSFGSGGATAVQAGQVNINTGASVGAYGIGISGPSGNIVGAGQFSHGNVQFDGAVWAVNNSGQPDANFGNGGTTLGPGPATGSSTNYEACGEAVAPDGSPNAGEIYTVGETPSIPNNNPCTSAGGGGFVAAYAGYGPPPPPPHGGTAPTVSTGGASSITSTSATVSGTVNPNGQTTSYHFDYGTTTSYGFSTSLVDVGGGNSGVPVSSQLTGLAPNTTYHYRLVASNSSGTTTGDDATFTTSSSGGGAPSASTGPSSSVGQVSATVTGVVNAGGLSTTYQFQYGTTTAYGSNTAPGTASGTGPVNVSATLRNLKPGTTYHYRLVASNSSGSARGADRTFTTAPPLRSRLHGVRSSYRIASVIRNGLTVKVGCSQPCSINGSLIISAATARRLGLGNRSLTIAGGRASLAHSGIANLVLRVARSFQSALSGQTSVPVTLRTVSRPSGGGPAVNNAAAITLTG